MANAFQTVTPTFTDLNDNVVTQITYPIRSSVIDAQSASVLVLGGVVDVDTPAGGTFTAATTDICTLTAHGFNLGLIVQVSNSGGALPTGLLASTNYYVIPINANTFYLATTLANALAGTHIDITGAGSGTNTISPTALATGQLILQASYDQSYFFNVPNETITISADGTIAPIELDYLRYPFYYVYASLASGMMTFTSLTGGLKTEVK